MPTRIEIKKASAAPEPQISPANALNTKVDFRYTPRHSQSTICFPDDLRKTIVGETGDLRYGFHKSLSPGMEDFSTVIEFSLAGFQDDKVLRQWIESPVIPIVHTLIDRPWATLELIAFATRRADEGRVDNVLLSIKSKNGSVAVVPKIHTRTCGRLELESYTTPLATVSVPGSKSPLFVAAQLNNNQGTCTLWEEEGFTLYLPHGEATADVEARYFVRLPQEEQSAGICHSAGEEPPHAEISAALDGAVDDLPNAIMRGLAFCLAEVSGKENAFERPDCGRRDRLRLPIKPLRAVQPVVVSSWQGNSFPCREHRPDSIAQELLNREGLRASQMAL